MCRNNSGLYSPVHRHSLQQLHLSWCSEKAFCLTSTWRENQDSRVVLHSGRRWQASWKNVFWTLSALALTFYLRTLPIGFLFYPNRGKTAPIKAIGFQSANSYSIFSFYLTMNRTYQLDHAHTIRYFTRFLDTMYFFCFMIYLSESLY